MREFQPLSVPKPKDLVLGHSPWTAYAAVDLEIGAGNGQFAESYARLHPERALLALERTELRSRHLLEKATSLENLFAYRADAVNFVTHFIPDASLEKIFLHYPNPYPKTKQANQRWHNMPFMGFLLKKLKPQGTLTLATNLETYFREAEQRLVDIWNLQIQEIHRVAHTQAPRTLFEKKYLERGESCWNLLAIKADK